MPLLLGSFFRNKTRFNFFRNALSFGPSFEIIDDVEILVAESTVEEEMITEPPTTEIILEELVKLNSYDLTEEQMHQVAKDLSVKKELIEEADGDWRVLALSAVASEEESGIITKVRKILLLNN